MATYTVTSLLSGASTAGTFAYGVAQVNAGNHDAIVFDTKLNGSTITESNSLALQKKASLSGNINLNLTLSAYADLYAEYICLQKMFYVYNDGVTAIFDNQASISLSGASDYSIYGVYTDKSNVTVKLDNQAKIAITNSTTSNYAYGITGAKTVALSGNSLLSIKDSSVKYYICGISSVAGGSVRIDSTSAIVIKNCATAAVYGIMSAPLISDLSGRIEIDVKRPDLINSGSGTAYNKLLSAAIYSNDITISGFSGEINVRGTVGKAVSGKDANGYSEASNDSEAYAVYADNILINGDWKGETRVSLMVKDAIGNGTKQWATYAEANASGLDTGCSSTTGSIVVTGAVSGNFLITAKGGKLSENGGTSWKYTDWGGYASAISTWGSFTGKSGGSVTVSGNIVSNATTIACGIAARNGMNIVVTGKIFAGNYKLASAGNLEQMEANTQYIFDKLADYKNNISVLSAAASGYAIAGGAIQKSCTNWLDLGNVNDTVVIAGGAVVFGAISLGGGDDRLSISSGAAVYGDIINRGNLTLAFDVSGQAGNQAILNVSSAGSFNNASTIYQISCDTAASGSYILVSSKVALSLSDKTFTVSYGSQKINLRVDGGAVLLGKGKSLELKLINKQTLTFIVDSKDIQPPDIPGGLSCTSVGTNVTISWTASEASDIGGYMIRYGESSDLSGNGISVSGNEYTFKLLQGGTYYCQVAAFDTSGNVSGWSSVESFVVTVKDDPVYVPDIVPQAEYMYGCTATVIGMMMGYYDRFGYMGYDVSNLIQGTVELNARGLDGNKYDMDAFDTVLGNAIASPEYVARFYGKIPAQELPYTFADKNTALNTAAWNCIADYLGTGQYWRGNDDLSTLSYEGTLKSIAQSTQTNTIANITIPIKYMDFKYGLSLYVENAGYSLDANLTRTVNIDTNNGSFTFEDYMAEIDAGRVVAISIVGHSLLGYGYNLDTREVIFDDTYNNGVRMQWGGSYYYSGQERAMKSVTVIAFDTSSLAAISHDRIPRCNLNANGHSQIVAWDSEKGKVGYVATNGEAAPPWAGIWEWSGDEASMWKVVGVGRFSEGIDHDGVLLYNGYGNTFAAWTNLNDGSYGYVSLCHVDGNFKTLALADFDNNGLDDVIIYDENGSFGIVSDAATYHDVWHVDSAAANTQQIIGAGYFGNADGKSDILVKNTANGAYYLWHNQDPTFETWNWKQTEIGTLDSDWEVAAIGDFQGDGVDDIIMWQKSTGNMYAWEDGKASTQRWVGALEPANWEVAAVGDYNGDGKEDLLLRELNSGWGGIGYWAGANASNWTDLNARIETNMESKFAVVA